MKAMQAIQIALKFSDGGMKLLDEMKADPLVRPGPWGGNHAMWIAGVRPNQRAPGVLMDYAPGFTMPPRWG